ncbi:PKD domain-containing protein, partial [Staphylococcus pasteuri_A]
KAPIANISPASQNVAAGTTVTLSAAGSSDEDGSIESYLWSTGETTSSIDVVVDVSKTISVTVTDNEGATATANAVLS